MIEIPLKNFVTLHPTANGLAERMNRSDLNTVRGMLIKADMNNAF